MQKVLVVDDEALCTLYLSTALEAEGFDVRSATKADQAIAIGREFVPDILVTDWMLKDSLDGIDIARSLVQDNSRLRILFITGMDREILEEQAKDLSYEGIIVKPIDVDNVVEMLRTGGKR